MFGRLLLSARVVVGDAESVYGGQFVRGRRWSHDDLPGRSFLPQQSDGVAHAMHGGQVLFYHWSSGGFRKLQRRVFLSSGIRLGHAKSVYRRKHVRGWRLEHDDVSGRPFLS